MSCTTAAVTLRRTGPPSLFPTIYGNGVDSATSRVLNKHMSSTAAAKTGPRDEWDDYFSSLGMIDPRRPQVARPAPRRFGWDR